MRLQSVTVEGSAAAGSADRPFAGDTASFYTRYRREYPPELIARLREFSRGGQGRLLDVGCGTGLLVLPLAEFFSRVVGIDPEPDMLREARKGAHERNVANAEWLTGSSDHLRELASALGHFDLVTIGTAFHFMEPRATLAELQKIAAGGAVAVLYNGSPMWLHTDPWARALRSVLEARIGRLGSADFTAASLRACEDAMRELGYTQVERWERTHSERIDLDFVIGHILSAASTDQIPPAERRDFADEVRSAVTAVARSGHLVETVTVRAVIGHTDDGL